MPSAWSTGGVRGESAAAGARLRKGCVHGLRTEADVWKAVEGWEAGHVCGRKMALVAIERMD